jgi:hypothetical protein
MLSRAVRDEAGQGKLKQKYGFVFRGPWGGKPDPSKIGALGWGAVRRAQGIIY